MTTTASATPAQQSTVLPMVIIGVLFFIFGFVTWLNGSLIPFLKIICELNEFQALFVTFAFYIAYTVMAFPMSFLLNKTGYRNGMAIGLAIMVVGSLAFIPAAKSGSYIVFLFALFILGTGLTILQTASNPYVVKIGPSESAAMRISIMGLINKAAGVIVPYLFYVLILADMGDVSEQSIAALSEAQRQATFDALSNKLIMPYIYMALALTALIGLIKFSGLPELPPEQQTETQDSNDSVFNYPQVVLGAIALFAYVGVEVIAGDTIGLYGSGLGVSNFASLTSYTMVFMVIGYIIGVTCIPRFISQRNALLGSAIAGILCIVGIIFSSTSDTTMADILWGWTGIAVIPNTVTFVALMGLAHALVWPSLWPLALTGVGRFTSQASALLIMGISGGAILPLVFGKLAHVINDTQLAYVVGIPCYVFILFYALKGHKMRQWS